MNSIMVLIIYFISCILGYLSYRYVQKNILNKGEYTIEDRNFGLILSATSYILIIVALMEALMSGDNNKPSKW